MSIVDSTDDPGEPADLLEGHESREPRVPDRWKVVGLVLLLLLVGGLMAARSLGENRAEQQARDAAFAIADTVHLRAELTHTYGAHDESAVLSAEVRVHSSGGGPGGDRVTDVRIEGEGLTPRAPDLSGLLELPGYVRPVSDVDCGPVSAGRFRKAVVVVLDVVPRSGVTHSQRMPVQPAAVREALLQACDLPDPDAQARVEVQGAADGTTLLLYVETVQRSKQVLVLESLGVPGFDVRPVAGFTLPRSLAPGTGGLYGFSLRVTDCAAARAPYDVAVRLRLAGASETRTASTTVSQPQPGGVLATQLLQRLASRAC